MATTLPTTNTQQTQAMPGLVAQGYQPQTAQKQEWNVDDKQLVQNQVNDIIKQDSPLMQQAAGQAKQAANARGLLNSSIAIGSAQDAVIRNALPMAQQNAQTYAQSAQFNADAGNRNQMFNADVANQSSQFNTQANNQFAIAQREDETRREMFNAEQVNRERAQILDNQAQLERLGLQINSNQQNIPTSFAANISNTTMMGVNAILADGNLSADAKRGAIDNLVKYANSQIAWASAFYSTAIPPITAPA